jgi:hypothetical protein
MEFQGRPGSSQIPGVPYKCLRDNGYRFPDTVASWGWAILAYRLLPYEAADRTLQKFLIAQKRT